MVGSVWFPMRVLVQHPRSSRLAAWLRCPPVRSTRQPLPTQLPKALTERSRWRPVRIIVRRVKRNWLKENGGPVAVAALFLAVALALVFQHGIKEVFGWISLAVAVALIVLSFESVQRRIPWRLISRKELTSEFWEHVFEALPFPAFVKEFPQDSHFRDNDALKHFQGEKPAEALAGTYPLIQQDHRQGDSVADQYGTSAQLELTDKVTAHEPRAILTLKSRIKYGDRKYIVGCYVPVMLPRDLVPGTSLKVVECGGQILFYCPPTTTGDNHKFVTIGKSLPAPQAAAEDIDAIEAHPPSAKVEDLT